MQIAVFSDVHGNLPALVAVLEDIKGQAVDGVLFVNVGSAGKPKDGDPRACYAIMEVGADTVKASFRRVPYDVDGVATAIRQSDLPDQLADHLEQAN